MKQSREIWQPKIQWLRAAVCICVLFLLVALTDARPPDVQAQYQTARLYFLHGQLEKSQSEAAQGYARYRGLRDDWSSRFQLLEARSMLYRGLYGDAISLLHTHPVVQDNRSESIQQWTLEAIVLGRLQQYEGSERKLLQAEALCQSSYFEACGETMKARGLLALEHGNLDASSQSFQSSLAFAHTHNDQWLEADSLLNLSAVALQREHFDEALSYSQQGLDSARRLDAENSVQTALGNMGWAYFGLGDAERASDLLGQAEREAARLGNQRTQIKWLTAEGTVYQNVGELSRASQVYRRTLVLAKQIDSKADVVNSLEQLANLSAELGEVTEAGNYLEEVAPLVQASGNRLDRLEVMLVQGKLTAVRREDRQAEDIFRTIQEDPASQTSMRLGAGHELARLYEVEGNAPAADRTYKATLATFASAQEELKNEDSKLPFLANATPIYDDYIHFLVEQNEPEEALAAADQSRARTLEQGLGLAGKEARAQKPMEARAIARKTGASLLFYWLSEKQSYLWAITPAKVALYPLPARRELIARVDRYRKVLLGLADPIDSGDEDGRALYQLLVAPAHELLRSGSQVTVLADGALSKLNFETLIVSGADVDPRRPHYWIEDATLSYAPSLLLLAHAQEARRDNDRLLLLGDAVSPSKEYPNLPMAATEMQQIEKHFAPAKQTVFTRAEATADAYFRSGPEQYGYIHFVTHAVASNSDPLDSAILLSRNTSVQDDSFKLYARQILRLPIHARLVTISACYGSGMRSYAGEGLVGLSWAFLRAGAHSVIGALWEVSDESTPRLMDQLYRGLEAGLSPSDALHQAKLTLLHSGSGFRKPYYWGPFQLYSGM